MPIINFVSVAAKEWTEMRRQWVGHQAEVPRKAPQEPVIRFLTPFICLNHNFLWDIWILRIYRELVSLPWVGVW